jgi:hypothetical protein
MAFAGIFQPFAWLRWIRFGLFKRAVNSGAGLRSHRQTHLLEGLFVKRNRSFPLL